MSAPTALSIEWVKEEDNPTHAHVVLGRPFKVKVNCDQPAVTAITVTLTVKTGTGVLTGTTTGTITVGGSSVEITGAYYSKEEDSVVFSAESTGLTTGDSAAVDVIALRLVVVSINDGNDVKNGVAFDVVLRLVDPDGDYHAPGVLFEAGVTTSAGTITSVTPAEFAADQLADVTGSFTFCGPAGVDRVLTATGFAGVTNDTSNFNSILGDADHLTITAPSNGKAFCPHADIVVTVEVRDVCEYVLEDDDSTVVTFAATGFTGTGNATASNGVATKTLNTADVSVDTLITMSAAGLANVSVSTIALCLQFKCGTSGNTVPTLLMKCGTSVNAVPTLLRNCPPVWNGVPCTAYCPTGTPSTLSLAITGWTAICMYYMTYPFWVMWKITNLPASFSATLVQGYPPVLGGYPISAANSPCTWYAATPLTTLTRALWLKSDCEGSPDSTFPAGDYFYVVVTKTATKWVVSLVLDMSGGMGGADWRTIWSGETSTATDCTQTASGSGSGGNISIVPIP